MTVRKYLPISIHKTLNSQLQINWDLDYHQEYKCPGKENKCCGSKLTRYRYQKSSKCNLVLDCDECTRRTHLTCPVSAHIFKYCPEIECPNPLCNLIGHNNQKGWVYQHNNKNYKCYFCKICFKSPKKRWSNFSEKQLPKFSFEEDIWSLEYFNAPPVLDRKTLSFSAVKPDWYKKEIKKYVFYLLKSVTISKAETIIHILVVLKQFGKIANSLNIKNKNEIKRNAVTKFLDVYKVNSNKTINCKLSFLKSFFEWLDLDTSFLIRSRDSLKVSKKDADWLDEVTRQSIKQHLRKIPIPIAYHYLIQVYIAARPRDVCQLSFDCLVEENGKWYVNFFQHKTQRWHRILANREIRKIIEQQQQWIKENIGKNYYYLFCHFTNIRQDSYPLFSTIKPYPKPPSVSVHSNPMVRIIRMLIEKENILDANGQKPYFTGKITRHSRLQEIRTKYGMEAAQLYADHISSTTTFQHYAPPTREQIAEVDLRFQKLLLNPDNKFLPWQSLPHSLLKNPTAHELDLEIAPRLVVYGHCALDPKTPCPINLFPKCYGCSSFRPSTGKLPLYERQYEGEQQRLTEAEKAGAELASEEAKATITAMDKWLPELRRLAHGEKT